MAGIYTEQESDLHKGYYLLCYCCSILPPIPTHSKIQGVIVKYGFIS